MSLENVIVKDVESVLVGTIKVRNLSFHKEVIVRASWNDWQSQEDTFCTFSQVREERHRVEVLNVGNPHVYQFVMLSIVMPYVKYGSYFDRLI